jgi:hypothetical protein
MSSVAGQEIGRGSLSVRLSCFCLTKARTPRKRRPGCHVEVLLRLQVLLEEAIARHGELSHGSSLGLDKNSGSLARLP